MAITTTTYGQVEGIDQQGVHRFAGIPFAKPPVGELRFRPPQPPERWDGVRPAKEFAHTSLQTPSMIEALFGTQPEPSSEDCLYLNVWTPGVDDADRPVMVWIHGGGFMMGSGSSPIYHGETFARRGDVVLVTLNYRLAELGFSYLAHLDESCAESANCGILDQIAALEWVRDNIAAFGGDPANVTIFGESAGGMSVGTLMAMPRARGLFHKAILQSGAAHTVLDAKHAAAVTDELMKRLEVSTVDELVAVSPERLLPVRSALILEGMQDIDCALGGEGTALGLPWQPVHDGVVLPQRPIDALREGSAAGIPTLVGTTLEEWKLFGLMMDTGEVTLDDVVKRGDRVVGDGRRFVEAYASAEGGERSPKELFGEMATDFIFRIPAIRLAERQVAVGSPTWMYRFDWASTAFGGNLGACHAIDVPFVFRAVDDPRLQVMLGDGPPPVELAEQVQDAWIAFARTGDPNHPNLPAWPAYDLERRATMALAEPCRVIDDPDPVQRQLWETVL